LVQDSPILDSVRVPTVRAVTGPGGVTSGGGLDGGGDTGGTVGGGDAGGDTGGTAGGGVGVKRAVALTRAVLPLVTFTLAGVIVQVIVPLGVLAGPALTR